MHDMTHTLCPAPRSAKAVGWDTHRFSRSAILIAMALVWLIGQGWTAYVHESRVVNRDGHGGAIAEGYGSQSSPQKVGHSRLN
jgi:hypothetical protein